MAIRHCISSYIRLVNAWPIQLQTDEASCDGVTSAWFVHHGHSMVNLWFHTLLRCLAGLSEHGRMAGKGQLTPNHTAKCTWSIVPTLRPAMATYLVVYKEYIEWPIFQTIPGEILKISGFGGEEAAFIRTAVIQGSRRNRLDPPEIYHFQIELNCKIMFNSIFI